MKSRIIAAAVCMVALPAFTEEGVFVPWEEFKAMYRQVIEEELEPPLADPDPEPMVWSLDQADYALNVGEDDTVRVEVSIQGALISGVPETFPLFGPGLAFTASEAVGGQLLSGSEGKLCFLPETEAPSFEVRLAFLIPAKDDNDAQLVNFGTPPALQNSLSVAAPEDTRILSAPGVLGPDGRYHFPAASGISLRYARQANALLPAVVEVDTLSRVQVGDSTLRIDTYYEPLQPLPDTLQLTAPAGARLADASIKIEPADPEGNYRLLPPPSLEDGFSTSFLLDISEEGDTQIVIPLLASNMRQQHFFLVDEPENGSVGVSGEGVVERVSIASMKDALRRHAPGLTHVAAAPAGQPIMLAINRFEVVDAPPIILDAQYLYTSIDENGTMISVLVLDAPAELGQRLALTAMPDSELWSLSVNGKPQSLYAGDAGTWVIPLAGDTASHVELAVLQKGPKLGLQGSVDVVVPGSGLPSKLLGIGLALPPRVEILSVEGPVKAAPADSFRPPAEFVGKPYHFSHAFYQGEGLRLSLTYKEPVKTDRY